MVGGNEKPLVIMPVFNRPKETMAALGQFAKVTNRDGAHFVIVDNGSDGDLPGQIVEWAALYGAIVRLLPENIGCPAALNLAINEYRRQGQAVVKVDNDVMIETPRWIFCVSRFLERWEAVMGPTAMVSLNYPGSHDNRAMGGPAIVTLGRDVWRMKVVVGHAVWHTGAFMDQVGHFDVLSDEHIYGFEDLIMCEKARQLGMHMVEWAGWSGGVVARNSLGHGRDAHIQAMRPLFNARIRALRGDGAIRTGKDGQPGK